MLYIVEGIDRVGKTTLVERMKDELGCVEYKCKPKEYMVQYFDDRIFDYESNVKLSDKHGVPVVNLAKLDAEISMLETLLPLTEKSLVIDRLHLSEAVYGNADRGYICMPSFFDFDIRLAELGTTILYVKSSCIKRSSYEHGSDLSLHELLFEELVKATSCNVIELNYASIDYVIEYLKSK